jgi:hypothetical protein
VSCPIADIPYDEKLQAIKNWTISYEELTGVESEIFNASNAVFAKIKLCKQHLTYHYTAISTTKEETANEAYYLVRRFIWNYCACRGHI